MCQPLIYESDFNGTAAGSRTLLKMFPGHIRDLYSFDLALVSQTATVSYEKRLKSICLLSLSKQKWLASDYITCDDVGYRKT